MAVSKLSERDGAVAGAAAAAADAGLNVNAGSRTAAMILHDDKSADGQRSRDWTLPPAGVEDSRAAAPAWRPGASWLQQRRGLIVRSSRPPAKR